MRTNPCFTLHNVSLLLVDIYLFSTWKRATLLYISINFGYSCSTVWQSQYLWNMLPFQVVGSAIYFLHLGLLNQANVISWLTPCFNVMYRWDLSWRKLQLLFAFFLPQKTMFLHTKIHGDFGDSNSVYCKIIIAFNSTVNMRNFEQ